MFNDLHGYFPLALHLGDRTAGYVMQVTRQTPEGARDVQSLTFESVTGMEEAAASIAREKTGGSDYYLILGFVVIIPARTLKPEDFPEPCRS